MKKPTFLLISDILEIHNDQIASYGGTPGIRDITLLQSALGAPSATYGNQFLHTNIYEMATTYLFHIIKNHPFIDGNKRTGVVAAFTFLFLNGYILNPPQKDFFELVLSLAQGKISKPETTLFIQRWTIPIDKTINLP